MRKLLVTGGAGFIGVNFVHYWLAQHPADRVVVLDALTYAGNPASLPAAGNPHYRFVRGNICDQTLVEQLMREEGIDTVVHFAAESHVDRSITGPDAFIETNVVGTHALLKAAKAVWLGADGTWAADVLFHHVSTDEVYGSLTPEAPAFTEDTAYAPNSPYAASKAASDHLVRAYHHTYGMPVTTSNCSNNYGPYQFPEKLIPLMLVNALRGKALPIYGDGRNVRDWLYVDDHCRGIERVMERGRHGETYNIGGNNEWHNIDIVQLLCRLVDEHFAADATLHSRFPDAPAANGKTTETLITYVTDRPGHDRRYAINADKARLELGYVPQETFESGIRKTLSWYLDNEAWWQGIMDGSYREE
ncbi:MAG: dTDP-glucose 4,6-dehydratase [Gammaproteobacteria bacterium HGW-Gammaproteobacteria-1]|jgi:dTDP-glucose 4,6-dehydratase|nr:MAG: dTDP-glucose 4,6-dehydratase [Gammaproteobacteria bacterium HGW-Gammaproteobacteria-1]